jgi:hypothetical protein
MKLRMTLMVIALLIHQSALAGYTRAGSVPVEIDTIYSNEWGSPFVTFKSSVNAACSGMYLYDITIAQPSWDLRRNKMAILLAAKLAGKRVVLDYYYDPTISGWSACYILGIQIVDQ